MEGVLISMNSKLDAWAQTYVPRNEINEMFRARDEQIKELKEDKKNNRQSWPYWITAAIALAAFVYSIWPKG